MDIIDIKIIKEKLKKIAGESILFSIAPEELQEFCKEVDSLPEKEEGVEAINKLLSIFENENGEVRNKMAELKILYTQVADLQNSQ